MYIPSRFNIKDPQVAIDFIQRYGFATLVGLRDEALEAVHIPLETEVKEKQLFLHGHVAKGNPIGTLTDGQEVMALFTEPHAYVSSSWYDHINVPTWNYIAVHAYGTLRQLHDQELLDSINQLVDRYEEGRPERYKTSDMPPEMLEAHLNGLIGFEMRVTRMDAKCKLSQNRNDKDFYNIVRKLKESEFPLEREIASEMEKIRPQL